ncbi:hypothetical protein [Kribbella alba]
MTKNELAENCATACDAIDSAIEGMALALAEIRAGNSDGAVALLDAEIDRQMTAARAIDPAPRHEPWSGR